MMCQISRVTLRMSCWPYLLLQLSSHISVLLRKTDRVI